MTSIAAEPLITIPVSSVWSKPYRIMAYDDTYRNVTFGVEATWRAGSVLFRPWFDKVVAAKSWEDVLAAVADAWKGAGAGRPIELQFWGHGAPGRPLIGGVGPETKDTRWAKVHTVWFRCCSVFRGERGDEFAFQLTRQGCRVVAHTVVIGAQAGAQSYMYGATKDILPWWPNTPPNGATDSRPWAPRTVMFWTMRLPIWTFDRSVK